MSMDRAAELADEVARELRNMPRDTVTDPLERVRWNGRLARRCEDIALLIRETLAQAGRPRVPVTTKPKQRRGAVCAGKGRVVAVECRRT